MHQWFSLKAEANVILESCSDTFFGLLFLDSYSLIFKSAICTIWLEAIFYLKLPGYFSRPKSLDLLVGESHLKQALSIILTLLFLI